MSKPIRYIIYFLIGLSLYFILEKKDGGESLEAIHQQAPMIILGLIAVMVVLRVIVERKRKKNDEQK